MQYPREPPSDDQRDPQKSAPCECELPGPFCSGVPGILAAVIDSRVMPDANVERCDICERYPSDETAREKLQELGLLSAKVDIQPKYLVHCYVLVRVSLLPRPATSPQAAARQAQEQFEWSSVDPARIEFVESVEFLVDVEGDEDHTCTKRYAADLMELPR